MTNENQEVRKASLQRLGKVAAQSPRARELIIETLDDDEDDIVLLALSYIQGFAINAHAAVPKLTSLMAGERPANSKEGIQGLLAEIVGVDLGSDPNKWAQWWEENHERVVAREEASS